MVAATLFQPYSFKEYDFPAIQFFGPFVASFLPRRFTFGLPLDRMLPFPLVPADGVLTAVIVLPHEGKTSFGSLMKTTQDVKDFFAKHYSFAFGPEGPSEEIAKTFLGKR